MRILLVSYAFAPSVGGIETVSLILARRLTARGHEVAVVTLTPSAAADRYPFSVLRRPSVTKLLQAVRWSHLVFHNNVSLSVAWPMLLVHRRWIVAHHTWLPKGWNIIGWKGRLKRWALRHAVQVSVSQALADQMPGESLVIPDPYDDEVFRQMPGLERKRDLIFVGRLVSDKGVTVLLTALELLGQMGRRPSLTVVGEGREGPVLRQKAEAAGLTRQVDFVGARQGEELAKLLNEHRIIAVPSVWDEPFGIVALEGIACGCVAVGSAGGGLPEAIGACGLTFPNNNASALAERIAALLDSPRQREKLRQPARAHLQKHAPDTVVEAYERLFEAVLNGVSLPSSPLL